MSKQTAIPICEQRIYQRCQVHFIATIWRQHASRILKTNTKLFLKLSSFGWYLKSQKESYDSSTWFQPASFSLQNFACGSFKGQLRTSLILQSSGSSNSETTGTGAEISIMYHQRYSMSTWWLQRLFWWLFDCKI